MQRTYVLTFASGEYYVGKTAGKLHHRVNHHFSGMRHGRHHVARMNELWAAGDRPEARYVDGDEDDHIDLTDPRCLNGGTGFAHQGRPPTGTASRPQRTEYVMPNKRASGLAAAAIRSDCPYCDLVTDCPPAPLARHIKAKHSDVADVSSIVETP